MTISPPEWVEHPQAATLLVREAEGKEVPLGGRFVCSEEAHEESMWALFADKGLSLRGFGQCEVVAMRIVRASDTAIGEVISEMRQIALESGYRLQSIEAGDVESGKACVLAGEAGYVPWWEQIAKN